MAKYIEMSMSCTECGESIPEPGLLVETAGGEQVGIFCDRKCWKLYRLKIAMFEQVAKMARISNQEGAEEEITDWIAETHHRIVKGE